MRLGFVHYDYNNVSGYHNSFEVEEVYSTKGFWAISSVGSNISFASWESWVRVPQGPLFGAVLELVDISVLETEAK